MRNFNRSNEIIKTAGMYTPPAKQRVDWSSLMDNIGQGINDYQDNVKKQALVNALQSGNPDDINAAYSAYDPTGAMANKLKMDQLNQQREWSLSDAERNHQWALEAQDRQLANSLKLAQLKHSLAGNAGTAAQQNIEYLVANGVPREQAQALVFAGQNPAFGQIVPELGKKGTDKISEKFGEDYAENELALRDAQINLENLKNTYAQTKEMLRKAKVGANKNVLAGFVDRRMPTELLDEDTQKARQWLQSGAASQTLDQAEKLSGPKSDNDIKFLKSVVAGDITQFTPAQIEGAWERIIKNAEDEILKRSKVSNAYSGKIPTNNDAFGDDI